MARRYKVLPILLKPSYLGRTSIVPRSNRSERISVNTQLIQPDDQDLKKVENLRDEANSMRMSDCKNHIGFGIYNEEVEEPMDL